MLTEEQLTTNGEIFEGYLTDYHARQIEQRRAMEKRLKQLIMRERNLLDLAAAGIYDGTMLRTKHQENAIGQSAIRDHLINTKQAIEHGVKSALAYITLLSDPQRHYRNASDTTRRLIIDALFGELWLGRADGDNNPAVTGTLQAPVAALFDRIQENDVAIPQETKNHPALPGLSGQFDTTPKNQHVSGVNKFTVVGPTGIEPMTSTV